MRLGFRRLLSHIGRRGAFLLFLAEVDLIYALGMLFPTSLSLSYPTTRFLMQVSPLWVWGLLWLVVGIICLIFAFREKDAIAYAAAMFLKVLWGLTFLLGWIFTGVERGYQSSAVWLTFAAICLLIATWPEPE